MIIGAEPLDLQLTLMDSGQCFRWTRAGEWYGCVLAGEPVWLRSAADGIDAKTALDTETLRRYLDLDRDYAAIAREYDHIPAARRAIELLLGLRVLNQPAWEALICFILSANNNISRIYSLTQALCRRYGMAYDGPLYGFPTPEQLADASEDELRALKVGYRAPFLIATAQRVCDGFPLDALCQLPYAEAHKALTTLPGVGDKVADCVLLFGCGHTSAFPVDVWVERLVRDWLGLEGKNRTALMRQARELLGEHGGLLQQFLFHAARTGAIDLNDAVVYHQ